LALVGAALVGPACALVLGARELPEGTGGTTGTSSTTGTGGASTSGTGGTGTSSSSTTVTCSTIQMCRDCLACGFHTFCATVGADAGCPDGSTCTDYVHCIIQCPQDGGFPGCANACNDFPPMVAGYPALQTCICAQCGSQCPNYCQ
jgi:hypothetical protein